MALLTICRGFSFAVWMLVFNRAMLGTSISLVMRFADSVIKTFVGSACLYLSAIMDATLFGMPSWFGNSLLFQLV
jgi:hypothetical protein